MFAFRSDHSHAAAQALPGPKVLVDAADTAQLEALRASGATQLVDYGAFSLWRLAPTKPGMAILQASASLDQIDDNIYLRGITIHPEQAGLAMQAAPNLAAAEEEDFWLVQFIGPTLPEWQSALQSAGLEIVSYIPNNTFLVWGNRPEQALAAVAASTQAVQWTGPYDPVYRLEPTLRDRTGSEPVNVSVQFYTTARLAASLEALKALAVREIQPPAVVGNTTVTQVQVPAQALADLAAWPDVINIEPYVEPELLDEIQGQILAGNITFIGNSLVASQPGYLQWLVSKGFPQQPDAYPLVDVVDDGLDSGDANNILHPDFYEHGDPGRADRIAYIENCSLEPSGNAIGGHGQLNAGILAGYNNSFGFPYQDAQGYRLGLGISPFGRVAGTKVFRNNGAFSTVRCGSSYSSYVYNAYTNGARITSNSWGASVNGAYDLAAQVYDALTRDSSPAQGNQEMLHIFAAGNNGPGPETIGSPGSAKNVLTVGALENVRDDGIPDGCNALAANSADDIAHFSSRGPTADGRIKPDILAPGTHVQAQASLVNGYTGFSICGGLVNNGYTPYYPQQQVLYTWSSGTSHSTPAIAGVAQLTYNYYQRVINSGAIPSPAMLKALILNTPRYLNGLFAGDTLPSVNQGWGSADMSKIFDGTPRKVFDQQVIFTSSGQTFDYYGEKIFSNKPLHVTLVWTDAPGSTTAAVALVNDLDLEVTVNGQKFRGNVFNGSSSVPGGSADNRNNVESVFLPAGFGDEFQVRVIAKSLNGNGVPNNGTSIDQDFALVIYNAGPIMPYQSWLPLINTH